MMHRPRTKHIKRNLLSLRRRLMPAPRVWTHRSVAVIQDILAQKSSGRIVLIGAGDEPLYKRLLGPYRIMRWGLSHRAKTDVRADVCAIPCGDKELDLIMSSSVLEHVYDIDAAVSEMYRTIKPGGYVYAEIPFMRGYHMIPQDFQRYTIAGIENLFEKHGFSRVDVGICSGPFTALALFLTDMTRGLLSLNKAVQLAGHLAVSLALHPMKYMDRLCENAKWAEICACNFYYLGKKDR